MINLLKLRNSKLFNERVMMVELTRMMFASRAVIIGVLNNSHYTRV
jgi:hypothetical protein